MRVISTKVDDKTYRRFKEKADARGSYPSLLLRDFVYRFLHESTLGNQGSTKVVEKKTEIDKGQPRAKPVEKSQPKETTVAKTSKPAETGNLNYTCEYCGKPFATKGRLGAHIRMKHWDINIPKTPENEPKHDPEPEEDLGWTPL